MGSAWPVGVLLAAVALAGCGMALRDQEAGILVQPAEEVRDDEPPKSHRDAQRCKRPGPSDIDGDGHADAVVGERLGRDASRGGQEAHWEVGGIHVFYGTASGLTATGADGGHDDAVFRRAGGGVPGEPTEYDGWGTALAVADFDGDGCADVAVGAPDTAIPERAEQEHRYSVGEVTILYGAPGGLSWRGAQTVRQEDGDDPEDGVIVVPERQEKNDKFGSALTAGDFDGDGIADLAIGAPGEARGENRLIEGGGCIDWYTPEEEAYCKELAEELAKRPKVEPNLDHGAISVVYGSRGGLGAGDLPSLTFTQSDKVIGGESENGDYFGHALTAGDFDADGVADLAVSSPGERRPGADPTSENDGVEPVVHVLSGKGDVGLGKRATQILSRATPGVPGPTGDDTTFGYELAAGNLDGEGGDDLAVGVPAMDRDGGEVVVFYSARAEGLSGRGAQQWTPPSVGALRGKGEVVDFGQAIAIGRFGGPGAAEDLAVGAPLHTIDGEQDGSVTVLFGGPTGLTAEDARLLFWVTPRGRNGDYVGSAITALPIRGRDRDDLLIGAPSAGENATPTDGAGALIEVPTDDAGPRGDAARRWRPDARDVAGEPVRGGSLGHSLS